MCFTCPSCSPVESLRFGALLFRFGCYNYVEGVHGHQYGSSVEGVHGHEYGSSGLNDMLLNHKHYINVNIKARLSFQYCMFLGTSLT